MSADNIQDVLARVQTFLENLAKQIDGSEEEKPFTERLCEVFGRDAIKEVIAEDLSTDWYNSDWVAVVTDPDRKEGKEGVRDRMAVVFLCSFKKALGRLGGSKTDVDAVYGMDFGALNSAYGSVAHTKIKIGSGKSGEKGSVA